MNDEITEEPYILQLIKTNNTGNFPVIYELQDPTFDKLRPRDEFQWRVLPPSIDIAAFEAIQSYIHRFSAHNPFMDDTDLPDQQLYYYKKLYADIDDDISELKRINAIHFGNDGVGHYGCAFGTLL